MPDSTRPTRDAYQVLNVRQDAHEVVVRAAFRALAALYHPDAGEVKGGTARMAELNDAYAQIRTPARRAVYDLRRQAANTLTARAATRAPAPRRAQGATGGVLDFGRYEGWTIADLALQDPDYLKWLGRHSSGIRYRREIEERIAETAPKGPSREERKRR
jgi:curved DNA-binding protein CbpA